MYLKWDTADCKGTAKIDQRLLYTMNDHDNHQTVEREIAELSTLERMRKRAADDDSTSLRNIYLEETRQSIELSSIGLCAVYGSSVAISGCWFHYTQAVGRQARKIGLAVPYRADATVRKCVKMLMSLPLLPAEAINEDVDDILTQCVPLITTSTVNASVRTLVTYVRKQWTQKSSVGPERICACL